MSEADVAIVTGGVQGLGAAIAESLLSEGYKVCIADIQESKGKEFVKKQQNVYGAENVIFSKCDVTKEEDYRNTFDLTLKKFGKIDVLINNAGVLMEQDACTTLAVNLMGPIIGCQTALKYMGKSNGGKGGIVINTASLAGILPLDLAPVYCATKHGVVGLTRSYGSNLYYKEEGITFTALCPSYIETDILKDLPDTPGLDLMTPEFVAPAVLKLIKDKINGSTLVVTKNEGFQYVSIPHLDIKEMFFLQSEQSC